MKTSISTLVLLGLVATGCNSKPSAGPGPGPGAGSGSTAGVAPAAGSGGGGAAGGSSGSAALEALGLQANPAPVDPTLMDAVIADVMDFTLRMVPVLHGFDGDCGKQAERLLTLEPLVQRIWTQSAAIAEASATGVSQMQRRIREQSTSMVPRIDAELARLHTTREQINEQEKKFGAACANDPRVQDAQERIRLFKKRPAGSGAAAGSATSLDTRR